MARMRTTVEEDTKALARAASEMLEGLRLARIRHAKNMTFHYSLQSTITSFRMSAKPSPNKLQFGDPLLVKGLRRAVEAADDESADEEPQSGDDAPDVGLRNSQQGAEEEAASEADCSSNDSPSAGSSFSAPPADRGASASTQSEYPMTRVIQEGTVYASSGISGDDGVVAGDLTLTAWATGPQLLRRSAPGELRQEYFGGGGVRRVALAAEVAAGSGQGQQPPQQQSLQQAAPPRRSSLPGIASDVPLNRQALPKTSSHRSLHLPLTTSPSGQHAGAGGGGGGGHWSSSVRVVGGVPGSAPKTTLRRVASRKAGRPSAKRMGHHGQEPERQREQERGQGREQQQLPQSQVARQLSWQGSCSSSGGQALRPTPVSTSHGPSNTTIAASSTTTNSNYTGASIILSKHPSLEPPPYTVTPQSTYSLCSNSSTGGEPRSTPSSTSGAAADADARRPLLPLVRV